MKFKVIGTVFLLSTLAFRHPVLAQDSQMSSSDLYELCSRFPLNSRCEGVKIPSVIPLEERSGIEATCFLANGIYFHSAKCKASVTKTDLLVYIEFKENSRPHSEEFQVRKTLEVQFSLDRIFFYKKYYYKLISPGLDLTLNTISLGFEVVSENESNNQTGFMNLVSVEDFSSIEESITNLEKFPEINWRTQPTNSSEEDILSNIDRLLETNVCIRCNLQNADLAGVDLKRANLEGANLQDANLEGVNFKEAYLVGANFDGANLSKAKLDESFLLFASMSQANLEKASLDAAQLQYVQLVNANLSQAEFTAPASLENANLENANLSQVRLSGVDLTGANLQQANLAESKLDNHSILLWDGLAEPPDLLQPLTIDFSADAISFKTNFNSANLRGANLTGAKFEDISMVGADLNNANLTETKLEEVNLSGANLCGTTMPDGTQSWQDCP
jgi:uncharacterized protein YjbI with pentapeptide repeats